MFTNRTLLTFIACAATLCISAQDHRTERMSGQEPTDISRSETRQGITGNNSADSVISIRTYEIRTYIDTLRTITMRTDTIRKVANADPNDRKGHYVELHAGVGYGSVMGLGSLDKMLLSREMRYFNAKAQESAGLSGVVQLQYACFFHPSVGIGIGAWMANYTSYSTIDGEFVLPRSAKVIDSSGEPYEHHATISDWRERHTLHTIGVPISLQFQAWGKKRGAAGFFFDLGIAPAYTLLTKDNLLTNYHVLSGTVEHWGRYPQWATDGVPAPELHQQHEFQTESYADKKSGLTIKKFTATAFFDIALLIRMSRHTDLLLGVYGQYTFLDIQDARDPETGDLPEIGWKTDAFPNLNMPPYNGMLASRWMDKDKNIMSGNLHPVEAGVKIGLHWHTPFKPKQRFSYEQHMDTTIQLVERHDSIVNERIETLSRAEHIQRQLDKLNRIYFAFDSYALTDDTKQFLADIAAQLQTIPNKVIIGGHASKEGTRRHNEQLAVNRALAVRRYLISLGIEPKRLIAKDYGSTVPNAINTGNEMSLDRRVEIIVLDE